MESVRLAANYRQNRSNRQPANNSDRLKNRITCAYTKAERAAIEWLNRTPPVENLPEKFAALRGRARREIAKVIDAATLAELVGLHAELLASRNLGTKD